MAVLAVVVLLAGAFVLSGCKKAETLTPTSTRRAVTKPAKTEGSAAKPAGTESPATEPAKTEQPKAPR